VNERSVVVKADEGCGFVVEITGDFTAHDRILVDRALRRAFKEDQRNRYKRMNREKQLVTEKQLAAEKVTEKGVSNAETE
jgi:hypothetical protein